MANFNGNNTLFMASLFTFLAPNYKLYTGNFQATTLYFGYILAAYMVIYFTTMRNSKQNVRYAPNYNETHFSGVAAGAFLGLLLRRRIRI